MHPLRLWVDFGHLGFFLEQIDDFGAHDFLLDLVKGAVVLELLGQFLRLDFLLNRDDTEVTIEFLVRGLDPLFLGSGMIYLPPILSFHSCHLRPDSVLIQNLKAV